MALCAKLELQPASQDATLRQYGVPTEAAFRALTEEWRHPARRAELEAALAELVAVVRGRVLG